MKRRDILKLICGSAIAWPRISEAQQNLPAGVPLLAPFLPGVNLAVGEFNEGAKNGGKLWTDYGYPDAAEIDYYAGKGFQAGPHPVSCQASPVGETPADC